MVHVNVDNVRYSTARQGGSFPFHKVIDGFMGEFLTRLNSSFEQTKNENPSLPRVTIVRDGTQMLAGDMDGSNGIYCWDFHIRIHPSGGSLTQSLPMRFSADTRRSIRSNVLALVGVPRLGVMGVRCISNRNLNPDRGRPRLNVGQRRNTNDTIIRGGLVTCFTDLTVGPTGRSARVTRTIPGVSLVTETSTEQVVWSNFSYVLTENAFLLFSRQNGAIKNIISFIRMEEIGRHPGRFEWYTNGWSGEQGASLTGLVGLTQGDRWDRVMTRVSQNIGVAPYTVARGNRDNMRAFQASGVNLSIAPHTRIGQVHNDTFRGLNIDTMEADFSRHFVGIMNTTPIGFRRVAEICGERRVTLLANRVGSRMYRIITALARSTAALMPYWSLIIRARLNETFRRGSSVGRIIADARFTDNRSFDFSGHITEQHRTIEPRPAGLLRMGFVLQGSRISENACGWIAAYNAFVAIGRFVHPAEIIHFIESNDGLLMDGRFGTSPRIYRPLFNRWGVRTTTTMTNRNLDILAGRARAAILCYWNTDSIKGGAHYVTIRWNEDDNNYTMWNGPVTEFDTIGKFLHNYTAGFIAMIAIW